MNAPIRRQKEFDLLRQEWHKLLAHQVDLHRVYLEVIGRPDPSRQTLSDLKVLLAQVSSEIEAMRVRVAELLAADD